MRGVLSLSEEFSDESRKMDIGKDDNIESIGKPGNMWTAERNMKRNKVGAKVRERGKHLVVLSKNCQIFLKLNI